METPAPAAQGTSKNLGLWIVAAIVVIGIIVALTRITSKPDSEGSSETTSSTEATVEATSSTDSQPVDTSKATLVTKIDADAALPYTSAFTKYAGRRVEFSSRCTMTPSKPTFTAGTKIMLDNRGSMANTIMVGDNLFKIPAYNFAFLTLSAESLPTTLQVSCGALANVGTITIK